PQEVAPAGDDEGEDGGDDHALADGGLALDGVELLDHLGQAPGAEAGEEHHPQQPHGVGADEGGEDPGDGGEGLILDPGQALQGLEEAALAVQYRGDDGNDAHDHDDALDEVVDGGGHVAPGDDVHPGEHRHDHHAHGVVDVEGHAEQAAEAVVEAGGVGDQEDEDDDRGCQLQGTAGKSLSEKFRHGGAVQVLGHDPGPAAQRRPGQQGPQQGVADARPGGGDAVLPAELTGVAHKNHGGEVAGAVGEGGEPGTHAPSAQDEAAD